jgi:UDP-N-acetylmuramyl tripeptide synthase
MMAARFYARQPATIVAITGTNGKTSIAEFTRQILAACGHKAASLGTIGIVKPNGAVYGSLTTPDPVTLHRTLAEETARIRARLERERREAAEEAAVNAVLTRLRGASRVEIDEAALSRLQVNAPSPAAPEVRR